MYSRARPQPTLATQLQIINNNTTFALSDVQFVLYIYVYKYVNLIMYMCTLFPSIYLCLNGWYIYSDQIELQSGYQMVLEVAHALQRTKCFSC